MNPFWDHILVAAAIAAAAVYFIWQAIGRKPKGGSGCGRGCGCSEKKARP